VSSHAIATFTKLESGSWRVQVRCKRQYVANSFPRRHDAEEWARDVERSIDRGLPIRRARPHEPPRIFSDLITLHIDDMAGVGKPIRRSKAAVLEALKVSLGRVKIQNLTRERLVEFGEKRAKQGAGPSTLAIDFSFIPTVLSHAAAVHGIEVSAENVLLARIALKHLDLIGKGNELGGPRVRQQHHPAAAPHSCIGGCDENGRGDQRRSLSGQPRRSHRR
jgi:hypothetical protein